MSAVSRTSLWAPRAVLRAALACGLGLGALVCAPERAWAQSAGYVVTLPVSGAASEALLHELEDGLRLVLAARGLTVADRATVRGALGVEIPHDTPGIVGFGRSMGATFVIAGTVRPIAGQYQLELRLYEVATGRVATATHAVGIGDEATDLPPLVTALFTPSALQASPEERARLEAEQRARAEQEARDREAQARGARAQEELAAREERARQAQETRDRETRELRNSWASGGRFSVGAGLEFGGRLTSGPPRLEGLPPPAGLVAGGRFEFGYALAPSLGPVGIELGGTAQLWTTPTIALMFAATGRVVWPSRGWAQPLRGSAGLTLGPFFSLSGARQASVWMGFDVRGEFDITQSFSVFAGLGIEGAPGILAAFVAQVGVRVHFGAPAEYPSLAPAEPDPDEVQPRPRRRRPAAPPAETAPAAAPAP